MPKRISAEIDMQILADVGLGMLNKDVAVKYGVSASYISKVSLGKKVPDIHIPKPDKLDMSNIDVNLSTIKEIEKIISQNQVIAGSNQIEEYAQDEINKLIIKTKVFIELLKTYKGGK
jgi:predicted transcriptional regulator